MNANKVLILKDDHTTWLVRLVEPGDNCGLGFKLTNTSPQPYVEFYDTRYAHTDFGQFVSRYFRSTIKAVVGGLCLFGSEPEWVISENGMNRVKEWLK